MSYPAANTAIASTAEQIFGSFQKQGAVITATPKMPPANWQYAQFHGLRFETPNPTPQKDCRHFPNNLLAESSKVCYEWDKLSIITVNYSRYHAGRAVPTVAQLAQQLIDVYKDQKKESTLNTLEEYATVPVVIPVADAIRVKIYTGYGTTGSRSEITFIKRGSEIWEFRTWEAIRWQYTSRRR